MRCGRTVLSAARTAAIKSKWKKGVSDEITGSGVSPNPSAVRAAS